MSNIIVTGGASGLGKHIVEQLRNDGHTVYVFDKKNDMDILEVYYNKQEKGIYHQDATVIGNVTHVGENRFIRDLDILINCAGVNMIDFLEDLSEETWDKVMDVNAKGIMMMAKACLPLLIKSKGTILNIVSNAAHMPMTSSLAYNSSKGAALIMTKQMARELTRRHGITVFSVSPNKLKGTEMSDSIDQQVMRTRGWSLEETQKYQMQGLLAGEETDPKQVAKFIAYLLQYKEHHKYLTGCDLQYGL